MRLYKVLVGGIEHVMQLDEGHKKFLGDAVVGEHDLAAEKQAPAPANKLAAPQGNK